MELHKIPPNEAASRKCESRMFSAQEALDTLLICHKA